MSNARIIVAKRADQTIPLERALTVLTEAIAKSQPDTFIGRGALGGEFGYGADFENDVFSMQCDYELDCICGEDHDLDQDHDAECPFSRPNFLHKASGFSVWWYKWIGRDMETKNATGVDIQALFSECLRSLNPPSEQQSAR